MEGWHADAAFTAGVGAVAQEAARLIDVTCAALDAGIEVMEPGGHLSDIGAAVQGVVEAAGFGVVREFCGHGIGRAMHEHPDVPNYGKPGRGPKLLPGVVLAVEPMVTAGPAPRRGARRRLERGDARRLLGRPRRAHDRRHRRRPGGPHASLMRLPWRWSVRVTACSRAQRSSSTSPSPATGVMSTSWPASSRLEPERGSACRGGGPARRRVLEPADERVVGLHARRGRRCRRVGAAPSGRPGAGHARDGEREARAPRCRGPVRRGGPPAAAGAGGARWPRPAARTGPRRPRAPASGSGPARARASKLASARPATCPSDAT